MTTSFSFKSTINDIQNRIVASSIKQISNLDLLKSEEAIREVIKSYTERFNAAEGMLTDISKYVAKSKNIVQLKDFNDLFESLYIDLSALYNDLEVVEEVLQLNLHRNKNYYLTLKKRLRDLWQRLSLTRLNIYDLSPGDESFYESFYSNVSSRYVANIRVDKKNGYIHIKPRLKKIFNNFNHIKSVASTTYPVDNEDGGVVHTTNLLNDLNKNYSDGTRDLLKNGLWKEEILCSDIPNMLVNIGSSSVPIRRNYRGVVSLVDIEYNYPVEINKLDIDVFGDKILDIDAVLYKISDSDEWRIAKIEQDDTLISANPNSESRMSSVRGRAFDVISFLNIQKIKIKHLRLVFNQQNFVFLNSDKIPERTVDQQINDDLSERRYELVKFGQSTEEELSKPVEDTNRSLYSQIMSIVESTRDLQAMLDKINRVLVPDVNVLNADFGKTSKFELGAWSVEPTYEEYLPVVGKFDSKPYMIRDRHILSVSINSTQETPKSSTCNWYAQTKGKVIPIVENDSIWRKEPINIIDLSTIGDFGKWPGSFILLDVPLDPNNSDYIGIYENGEFNYQLSTEIAFLNSRLLYLHKLTEPAGARYVVRYPTALYNTITQYILSPKEGSQAKEIATIPDIPLGVTASRREILQGFINRFKINTIGLLSDYYTITIGLSTVEEAKLWYGHSFPTCIFIDESIYNLLITSTIETSPYFDLLTISNSKLTTTLSNIEAYYTGVGVGPSNFDILATNANIAPLSRQRTL